MLESAAEGTKVCLESSCLAHDLKEQAYALGFSKVGVVPAAALNVEAQRLRDWLGRNYEGEMRWMARDPDKRTDPRAIFPAAKSVIVVALNYYTPDEHSDSPDSGKVSRYAWGDDYHDVLGSKLQSLLSWIKQRVPHADGKVCVDIQPVMDKAWAVRAGLGWLGKHTNVITQEFGSWIFIGELLLNCELEYDSVQVEDHCGTCTLCIDACPTAAIVEPYVLDSRRCISYLTIESRSDEIPREHAEQMHGWFYGCDICQDVCPWNRFAVESTNTSFSARADNVNVSLQDIIALTPDSYAERYRGSAMKRAKLHQLQRNARTLLEASKV